MPLQRKVLNVTEEYSFVRDEIGALAVATALSAVVFLYWMLWS